MIWQESAGSWYLIPAQPVGVVHFLGGAFVGTAPQLTYKWLLERLADSGFAVITTPFVNGFDHLAIARQVLNRFENILDRLQNAQTIGFLPVYGVGHSMGCKIHLLINSLFNVQRAGNVLISYNNFPVKRSIPLLDQMDSIPFLDQFDLNNSIDNFEFTPSPAETNEIIQSSYQTRRNLLIQFENDTIDQTAELSPILLERFPNMVVSRKIPGNHLTPLGQEIDWQVGEGFAPLEALGKWMKQELSKDLVVLKAEVCRWLNPTGAVI
ncbi:protein of unknown function DUF1350 [[Leptolyngbya] sp. PCC 7376]|uniref:DUF1350 family protein n=1 Tax=[Leptolyngbya] sp. PCC 7376 TaxID=111781 RepID=UPI00029F1F8F|nr:DUF1350 family protein [[Leptolyngbya] sp. PCC 7376]AFY37959.1 protein of unknown function DUF1350 [[Leptolyngbya] sp. PCC 7376]